MRSRFDQSRHESQIPSASIIEAISRGGASEPLIPTSDYRQRVFVEQLHRLLAALRVIPNDAISCAWELDGVHAVNAFLETQGFRGRLPKPALDGTLSAAIALSLTVEPAQSSEISVMPCDLSSAGTDDRVLQMCIPDATILSDGELFAAWFPLTHPPLSCVVFACPQDRLAGTENDLYALRLMAYQVAYRELPYFCKADRLHGVSFPLIGASMEASLPWMNGLGIRGGRYRIGSVRERVDMVFSNKCESGAPSSRHAIPSPTSLLQIKTPTAVAIIAHPPEDRPVVLLNGIYGPDCWVSAPLPSS